MEILLFLEINFPKHNVLIINRNMISNIVTDENNIFSFHNKNNEYVAEFSLQGRLVCGNIGFKKKLWAFTYRKSNAQLDYVFVNKL